MNYLNFQNYAVNGMQRPNPMRVALAGLTAALLGLGTQSHAADLFHVAQAGQRSACFQTPTGQVCRPCEATPSGTVCPTPPGAYELLPDAVSPVSINFTTSQTLPGHGGSVHNVSWSPDGQILASGSDDQTVRLWRKDGTPITTPLKHDCGRNCYVYSVAWSPDGQILASGSLQEVRLWRRDGTPITTIASKQDYYVYDLSWSSGGQNLASASSRVRFWRKDGAPISTLAGDGSAVFGLSWSPDGQTVASGGKDKTVRLWRRGVPPIILTGHGDTVHRVRWSPDGQILASASLDKTVRLWRKDGTFITTLSHEAPVLGLSWSRDGVLASASNEGVVKLWQKDGTLITSFKGSASGLTSLSWSPDGRTLAGGSFDSTVRLWRR